MIKRFPAVFTFIILNISVCCAQSLRWQEVSTEFGSLPKSVRVFKSTDSLNGRPFIAYFAEINLKDRKLDIATQIGYGKRFTPSQYFYLENSPVLIVNGTFFSFQTNQNLNLIIQDGKLVAYNQPSLKSRVTDSFYYPTRSAIGFTKHKRIDIAWLFTDTAEQWPYAFQRAPVVAKGKTSDPSFRDLRTLDQWKWWRMYTAIGGGPMLVQNKAAFITNKEEQMFVNGERDRHPRTAMGYTSRKKLIVLVIQGRFPGKAEGATLEEEAKILVDLGCIEALNLDGGGSSCMLINGKETIKPSDSTGQRAVPGILMIKSKK